MKLGYILQCVGEGSEKYHLNVHELPKFLKTILTGEEKPEDKHDLFYGLKALLDLQVLFSNVYY